MKVIIDCDNTMGVPGSDINDGLAIFYLMGQKDIELSGITTTYGNGKIDTVYRTTENMLKEMGRMDIPILRGCANRYVLESEAADYLVEMANDYPGELSIIATGALTNLYAAYVKDHDFFNKIAHLIIVGGIPRDLMISGKLLDEWNFSADPFATQWVLREGKRLTVINHNMGFKLFMNSSEFMNRLNFRKSPIGCYIVNRSLSWLEYSKLSLRSDGFYVRDLLAAVYLAHPQLFEDIEQSVSLNHKNLSKGLLGQADEDEECCQINMPIIRELDAIIEDLYESWLRVPFDFKKQLRGQNNVLVM
ncbi:nucleoside hydrolase [Desulfitobacterium sp. THU1]|uniref:nucleoside hydrolase n=1 Tax=Desulfitobacterium sp. THU1 TaxID=3138072 RepID=UPI00311F8FB1